MEEQVGFYVKRISESVDRIVNGDLKRFGLTVTQGRILGFLHKRQGKTVTQKDVEQYMGVSHATVSGVIRRLERNGFILVETDENDRRAKKLSVTEKELEVYERAQKTRQKLEKKMCCGMSDAEKKKFLLTLKCIYANIQR